MKKFMLTVSTLVLGAFSLVAFSGNAPAALAADGRDCDDNAVMYCGALSANELQQKYNQNKPGDLGAIFGNYGISSTDVANMDKAVVGQVHKDGRVVVNGKVVATNAVTVGRQNIEGSKQVSINGKTYFQRTPAVSFREDSLSALVMFKEDGTFDFAVLKACGNPVTATPKEQPKPEPKYTCEALTATKVDRTLYRFNAQATTANGAKVVKYVYDFGDGKVEESTSASVTHRYAKEGTYTAKVTVMVEVNGKVVAVNGANCAKKVTIEKQTVTPKEEKCPYPGKEQLPKNSEQCVAPQVKGETTPPAELPKTGAEQLVGAGVGLSSLSAAGYYFAASRRKVLGNLLNR